MLWRGIVGTCKLGVKRVSSVYFNPELDAMSVMRFMNPEEVRGWELSELREELAKLLE